MAKDDIIHFVGFITRMEPEDFVQQWEQHARVHSSSTHQVMLQQLDEENGKSRFKYLSRHALSRNSTHFSFLQGKKTERFPDQQVRVIQAGGYQSLQKERPLPVKSDPVTVLVFVSPKKQDASFYQQLSFKGLNLYEAYYENCLYSSILEFIIPSKEVPVLLDELKGIDEIEVSLYRDALVPHI